MTPYQPPFTITTAIIKLIADISENLGRLSVLDGNNLRLRRINRIRQSTKETDSSAFIEFILTSILNTIKSNASPQVKMLLNVLAKSSQAMNREALQKQLKLKDRKSFRARYLKPALEQGLIEMTIPNKPNSRLQKYALTAQGRLVAKP